MTKKDIGIDLSKKTALVAGGSSGIGASIVKHLTGENIFTYIADMQEPTEVVKNAHYISADFLRKGAVDQIFAEIAKHKHFPDILVCSAGKGIAEKLTEGDPAKWKDILELNTFSVLKLIRAFVPQMQKKRFGDVIIITSVSAQRTYPYGGIYASSKAALETIAETLRLETQPDIRVTVIAPGVVNTPFFDNAVGNVQKPDEIGWGALEPDDIADAVVYCLKRPSGVVINNLTIRPVAQPL